MCIHVPDTIAYAAFTLKWSKQSTECGLELRLLRVVEEWHIFRRLPRP